MNPGLVVLFVCAGGYVALALYGKYRTIKESYHRAQEEDAAQRAAEEHREA